MRQISPKEADSKMNSDEIVILDIREEFEIDAASVSDFMHIPMQQIPARMNQIPLDKEVAVLCHTGARSARVTQFLEQQGFDNIVNVNGGIERWSLEVDENVPRYRKAFGRAQVIS